MSMLEFVTHSYLNTTHSLSLPPPCTELFSPDPIALNITSLESQSLPPLFELNSVLHALLLLLTL